MCGMVTLAKSIAPNRKWALMVGADTKLTIVEPLIRDARMAPRLVRDLERFHFPGQCPNPAYKSRPAFPPGLNHRVGKLRVQLCQPLSLPVISNAINPHHLGRRSEPLEFHTPEPFVMEKLHLGQTLFGGDKYFEAWPHLNFATENLVFPCDAPRNWRRP